MNIPDLMNKLQARLDDAEALRDIVDQHLQDELTKRLRPDLDKIDEFVLYGSLDFIQKHGLDEAQRINSYISDRPLSMAGIVPVKVSSFLPPGVALLRNGDKWTLFTDKPPAAD